MKYFTWEDRQSQENAFYNFIYDVMNLMNWIRKKSTLKFMPLKIRYQQKLNRRKVFVLMVLNLSPSKDTNFNVSTLALEFFWIFSLFSEFSKNFVFSSQTSKIKIKK